MLKTKCLSSQIAAAVLIVAIGAAAGQPALAAEAAITQGVTAIGEISQSAWNLASEGRLDEVWQRVRHLPDDGDSSLAALRQNLESHEANQRLRQARTQEEFDKKLQEMRDQIQDGDLIKALAAAVTAQGYTDKPLMIVQDPQVQTLVGKAEQDAAAFERDGQWLKALSVYRLLEMMFENSRVYYEPMKRVARHVAVLRRYAPAVLYELYKKEALERGEEAPDPFNFEQDQWQQQLAGIEPVMLHEALSLARRQHVEGTTFEALMVGGIESLEVLLKTPGLEATFPSLRDADKTRRFAEYLATQKESLNQRIAQRNANMDYSSTAKMLQELLEKSDATIALPREVVVHEFGDGATSTLDDFTSVIWPDQKARFERTTTGQFFGVGIQITLVDRELTVVTPLEDTPAHLAGIKPGDRIVMIDGKSTLGIDLDTAVERITGAEGTKVTLGVKTPTSDQTRTVDLTRSAIQIVSIKGWQRVGKGWDYYIDRDSRIGYVRMTTFGPNTAEEMDAAVQQMTRDRGLAGLILDLRYNPGGRLDAAIGVANRFLSKGVIVSTTPNPNFALFARPQTQMADAINTYPEFPVMVLINRGSASASEIVSGAIKDHHRGLIVGERSFGKGSVQNLFRIGGDKGYLKLTTQYYRLPDGEIIHRRPGEKTWGVEPDVAVKMTDQQVADVIQARMFLDILHDGDSTAFDPKLLMNQKKASSPDVAEDQEDVEPEPDGPTVQTADEILTRGLDPQLETALLLMKTRLLGQVGG